MLKLKLLAVTKLPHYLVIAYTHCYNEKINCDNCECIFVPSLPICYPITTNLMLACYCCDLFDVGCENWEIYVLHEL